MANMRIGVDAASIVGDKGGVGWHTYHLLQAMLELKEDVDYVGYLRPGSFKEACFENWPESKQLRWAEVPRWLMSWRGRLDRLDLYHGPNFKMHTTGRHGGIVTIHDLWLARHPEYSKKVLGQRASSRRARATAHRARAVVTVSRFSAEEIISVYEMPPERVVVIHNGVAEDFRPLKDDEAMALLSRKLDLSRAGFILFVGGADPRKNHRTFLQAVSLAVPALRGRTVVLAGDAVHPFGDYREAASRLGVASLVRCPGRMSRDDLRLLYSYADLFVFPSLYEGFGMPVLEAMACGAPVITSATSALPEVAGEAAVLVNPQDADALSRAMTEILEDHGKREKLRELGLARAKSFTWRDAAAQTHALYRRLCA
jgi:glycosyltransferase involved in cell wall biosynthesis